MSSDVALQAMFDRFMGRFVLPLVSGEDSLLVSYPIGPGAEHYFLGAQELAPGLSTSIIQARQDALSPLVPNPSPEMLRTSEIRLLTALHNVLLCAHEELVGGIRGKARWKHTLGWATAQLAGVPECQNPETALRRHSLLHLAPGLTREDAILKTRSNTKRYLGQEPPKRALVWPKLRQVSTSKARVTLPEVIANEEARDLFTEILERSPLTCMLSMPYSRKESVHQQDLEWTPALARVLTDPYICRAVTYRHLEIGMHVVGPTLAQSLIDGLEQLSSNRTEENAQALAFGLRFIINLHFTHIWTAQRDDLTAPVERRWDDELAAYRSLFYGWFAAAMARADRIGAPLPPDANLRDRERHYRRAAAGVAGEQLEDAARHVDWIVPPGAMRLEQGGQS